MSPASVPLNMTISLSVRLICIYFHLIKMSAREANGPPILVSFFSKWLPTTVLLVPIKCSQWPAPSSAWARAATRPWSRKFLAPPHAIAFGILGAEGLRGYYFSRVAICDYRGDPVLDCYVVPTMAVTDYRTSTTGITAAHLSSGRPPFKISCFGLSGGGLFLELSD
jgi:hypothetical protein